MRASRRPSPRWLVAVALTVLAALAPTGCGDSSITRLGTLSPTPVPPTVGVQGGLAEDGSCHPTPPGTLLPAPRARVPMDGWYTNGSGVWTTLRPSGSIHPDGRIHFKWPWWRHVTGELKITARMLGSQPALAVQVYRDGVATVYTVGDFKAEVLNGYGTSGLQVTSTSFATEGCWEITGEVGSAKLTVVVDLSEFVAPLTPFR